MSNMLLLPRWISGKYAHSTAIYWVFFTLAQTQKCAAIAKPPLIRRLRSIIPPKLPFSLPWYEKGLEFSCTGCSKCCQVDGDVWLAPEEATNIVTYLRDSGGDDSTTSFDINVFKKKYVRAAISPVGLDGDLSQSWMSLKRKDGACTFLDSSGKCKIYDARPVQCYTYPFWPSLVDDPDSWNEESVLPDDVAIENGMDDRHWSREYGGCEGIGSSIGKVMDIVAKVDENDLKDVDLNLLLREQQEATIVKREEILAKRKEARRHWKRFPVDDIKMSTWYL